MEQENYLLPEWQADNLITEIKDLQADKERFAAVAKMKCENIAAELERKTKAIEDQVQFKKDQLKAFFDTVEKKSTKTQESYSMFSGKLVMKKPTIKIMHDDNELLEWAEDFAPYYVEVKETKKLKWSEFKNDLSITESGMLVRKDTGEVMEGTRGLYTEKVNEIFEVK